MKPTEEVELGLAATQEGQGRDGLVPGAAVDVAASVGAAAAVGVGGRASEPPVESMPVRRRTLPPPEWSAPRSVSGLALEWLARQASVARRRGPRAELGALRAKLRHAAEAKDSDAERVAAAALARSLAARGVELDLATKLARRSLMLGDDPALREELATWFAALGEPGLAAATLRPLVDSETGPRLAQLLTRIAVFLGRHGDARGAGEALASAAREAPLDPVAEELRGAIGAWAPDAVDAREAADSYLEAARRREAQGDKAAAFEDVLRAFEMAPDYPAVAEWLSSNLAARGRLGAADEVLREHARASGDRAVTVHRARLRDAIVDGEATRAFGAAFDAGLDRGFDPEAIARSVGASADGTELVTFDRLVADVGLVEIVAARLELAAESLSGVERARVRVEQGKWCAGPIGGIERAVEAWIDALVADPGSESAKAHLRQHAASSGDHGPLIEALVRVGLRAEVRMSTERGACLRELVVLADQRLSDPTLALWAVRRLLTEEREDEGLGAVQARLAPRARLQDEALTGTRVSLQGATGASRIELLRHAATALRGRPDDADEYARVLGELVESAAEERTYRHTLERLLVRLGRADALEGTFRRDLGLTLPKVQHERARLGLSALARGRGEPDAALELLEPLLSDGAVHRAGWAMVFALASKVGKENLRAEALRKIATVVEPSLHALLAAIACDLFLAAGDEVGARSAAEQACHADSSAPRSIASLARATMGQRDRVSAVALERAAGVVVPRGAYCRALAETFDALGEPENALAWTGRWLALRPGDRVAAAALLGRVTAAGDAVRIADALGWLLAQPEPLTELVPLVSRAVRKLAQIEPGRGATLARRALDVFGPRVPELRAAVLDAADSVADRGLAIAVMERQLASGAPGGDRAAMLLELARRRRQSGDADGAARSLVRALREGADAGAVLAELDVALPPRSSDGEISILEGRAEALSALSSADLEGTARAWRDLGAALWDLAFDPGGAVLAWERGAALDGEAGLERLARDLVAFGGHNEAVRRLEDLATRRRSRGDVARALSLAAGVALDGGLASEALAIALRALEADSSRADVLAIAERSATDKDIEQLERAYDIVARGALGIYGERAAHYRAARQLERRGFRERALGHAILAFEAVPAEGVTFVLMMRLAERTGDSTEAVGAIERVASQSRSPEERAAWLRRAALVAGSGDEGKRQRVEVLLRALDANPHGETLRSLGAALADLVRTLPDEREIAELRFLRALRAMLPRLEGPDGARVAIEAASTASGTFGATAIAILALERAAQTDASVDEFRKLLGVVETLATDPEVAGAWVEQVVDLVKSPYANVGPALVELGDALAGALGQPHLQARLVVEAALKEPDNAALIQRAEVLARATSDSQLLLRVQATVPIEQRVKALVDRADEAAADGDFAAAIAHIEEGRSIERLGDDARRELTAKLRDLYRQAERHEPLETLLREEMSDRSDPAAWVARGRELATLLSETERVEDAIAVVEELLAAAPGSPDLLKELLHYAVNANDGRRQADALSRLADAEPDPGKRLLLLARLAPLLASEGDDQAALTRFREILSLDERDTAALAALERDAERREDWESLAELLIRRAQLAHNVDEARQVRLHRAEVLQSRLGRPHDARTELTSLLEETGDHLVVLTQLADLNERLGARLRAAPLWLRASAMPKDRSEAGELARRACQAYLDGGDVESARRVFGEMADYPRSPKLVALRVDIERRSENPRALSEALEEMALSSMEPPRVRAGILVEAARAALAGAELSIALGQAQRAARIARDSAEPQLLARLLEYRQRGPGTREEAATTLAELRAIREQLSGVQRELHAFLLAEALDVSLGEGEGMRELSRVHAELGPVSLVALGMAERLARGAEPERALAFFDAALDGDLRELRRRGDVALAAAKVAERAAQPDRALGYLEVAAAMPDTRGRALTAQTELRTSLGRITDAPAPPSSLRPSEAPLSDPASAAPSSPRGSAAPPSPAKEGREEPVIELRSRRPGDPTREPVLELRRPSEKPIELTVRRDAPSVRSAPRSSVPARPSSIPPPGSLRASAPPKPRSRRNVMAPTSQAPGPPLASTAAPLPPTATGLNEEELFGALARGSIDAGQELMRAFESRPDRAHDLVGVCRRVAQLIPGDRTVLERLHQATLADRNVVYARAVEHVLRAFDPKAARLDPPPLSEQIEQPDRAHAVLFRDTWSPATEALGLVWSGAQHLFRRDPSSYGVTGLERVSPGAPTPLARLWGGATRLLGMIRTPLFQRKSGEQVTINVALLSPPALLLTGEVKAETPALGYHIGAMLAATLPEHVLLYGAPEAQVANVLRALGVAFGPPQPQEERGNLASVATLAEMLWESIPARAQRRLRELCDDPTRVDYEAARAAARQAVRRAGLFVSGDLTVAIRETCADLGVSTWGLDAPGGLAALCSSSPAVADLVRLATSPEYANTRWQQYRGRQPSGTWGTV